MQFTRQHVLLSEHSPIETLGRGTVWCQMLPRILDKSSAEKIISQGRPSSATVSSTLFPFSTSYASLGTLFPPSVLRCRERNLPSRPCLLPLLLFGFPRLVVFLCRQNGRRRHLALNIYGKVPFATAKLRRPFSRFLVPPD